MPCCDGPVAGHDGWTALRLRIDDYALIGDCNTTALVGRDGSIDWLCWPRFGSAACFAALLGTAEHGRWLVAPQSPPRAVRRRYRPGMLVLETEFETATGSAAVLDFMPPAHRRHLVRIVGLSGRVDFLIEFVVRFNHGATVPWINRRDFGALGAIAGPERVVCRSISTARISRRSASSDRGRRGRTARPLIRALVRGYVEAIDPFGALERTEVLVATMERSLSRGRAVDRRGQTLAHHLEGADLCADRRNGRRRHALAARAPGR